MYVACDYFQQISTIEMTYFITYTLNHVAHTIGVLRGGGAKGALPPPPP